MFFYYIGIRTYLNIFDIKNNLESFKLKTFLKSAFHTPEPNNLGQEKLDSQPTKQINKKFERS